VAASQFGEQRRKTMREDRIAREEFLANRKAAGRMIDVETCDIDEWYVDLADPYGISRPPAAECIGRVLFVASAESDGWVLLEDLPDDKRRALHARIERGDVKPKDDLPV
jgi:hypothetical protein